MQAGETVLIEGTGGVGLFGLQIAKAHGGARSSCPAAREKLARARALGADIGIDRPPRIGGGGLSCDRRLRGADHILELVGGAHLGKAVRRRYRRAHLSDRGFDGFEVSAPAGPVMLKGVTIQGIGVGHRRALEDLVRRSIAPVSSPSSTGPMRLPTCGTRFGISTEAPAARS